MAGNGEGDGPVVLTGATGFIGSHTLRALLEPGTGDDGRPAPRVRAFVRNVPEGVGTGSAGLPEDAGTGFAGLPEGVGTGSVEWVRGDLTDPDSVRGLCEGARAVVHLASYIGGDEQRCEAVNVDGTRTLMAEAVRAGVRRVVHLSTAAVYGAGPHRGIAVDEIAAAPVSAVSRTRLAGEAHARRAGGVVLRPAMVLGAGDRWVVPGLRELVARVPAEWDGGRAAQTVVDAGDLGRLIAAVAAGPAPVPPGTYHAGHPEPVRIGDLLAALAELGVLPPRPDADWPLDICRRRLRATPGRASQRQFALAAEDHWYRCDELWRRAGVAPGPGPLSRLAAAAEWYRQRVRGTG